MEKYFCQLVDALDKQNQILERLAQLAGIKKEHIILGRTKELEKLIREEGIIVSELGKWEDARFRLQKKISPALSATDLVNLARQDYPHLAQALFEVLKRLEINLGELNQLNRHNNDLLEQSLDHIAFLEAALIGNNSGAYTQNGLQSEDSPSRISLLDRRA